MTPLPARLVGRADEVASIELVLAELDEGRPSAMSLVGEPGIGKTRLLAELAAQAEARGHLVLSGRAAELERDLPFSAFVDALDEYVASLDPKQLAGLDGQVQAELAHVLPSLSALAMGRQVALQEERYRSHRAVRVLLEHLGQVRPLVLVLDDFHWADPGSVELLGALLRHPPSGVLITVALRPHPLPERLGVALERAHRAGALTRLELRPLTPEEARDLLDRTVDLGRVGVLYEESGGNPFYLEQLARSLKRAARDPSSVEMSSADIGVPPSVAGSLREELASLSEAGRRLLDGAAVAGDPFEPQLAAVASATSEAAAMQAVDELLEVDLIRTTEVPRRFRFRHPLVRHAVYAATPAGWRLGAHERCAEALAARGAPAAARAHHVERSAREGDLGAVAVLREAGEAAARLAPASSARWFASALRLLPEAAPAEQRFGLLVARAGALAATGHFVESHAALVEALETVPDGSTGLRAKLAVACARVEHLLGHYEQAHGRLLGTLEALPEPASPGAVGLSVELALNSIYLTRYEAARDWAGRAVGTARLIGDPRVTATALAMLALTGAMAGSAEEAQVDRLEAAAVIDALADDELARHLDGAIWLAAAELYLDRYEDADAHADRALRVARESGEGELVLFFLYILGRVWTVRGKLAEAGVLLDGGIEAARLVGNKEALSWCLYNRSDAALASGDLAVALAAASESVELTRDVHEDYVAAWAAVRLAGTLLELGRPAEALELLLRSAGGEEQTFIPGAWRIYCLELLTRCRLALGLGGEAAHAAARAEAGASSMKLPMASAWADRAAAAVALDAGDAAGAAARALAAADRAEAIGAPVEAALARTIAGRALGESGEKERAVVELQHAAAALDACGAMRYRQSAERELGRLGHRPHRRTRRGSPTGSGIALLTERELQVARLVVDRKTNGQIASELFLSNKTVETHLRNIFNKMGVATRVALARAVEHDDRIASTK